MADDFMTFFRAARAVATAGSVALLAFGCSRARSAVDATSATPLPGTAAEAPRLAVVTGAAASTPGANARHDDAPTDSKKPPMDGERPVPATSRVVVEVPYKLGDPAPAPLSGDDLALWNRGGTGELRSDAPPPEGHPMPRVIVSVPRVVGPHPASEVERIARRSYWTKVIACYAIGAPKNQKLHGTTTTKVTLTKSGRVVPTGAFTTTLADREVAGCLAKGLAALSVPKARKGSTATFEITVSPGDEPMAPRASTVSPGAGTLGSDAMLDAVRAGLPLFDDCYDRAREYAPDLWGRMVLRLHVSDEGFVAGAFEQSAFPDERVRSCVIRAANHLRFPPPAGGEMRILAPLRFGQRPVE